MKTIEIDTQDLKLIAIEDITTTSLQQPATVKKFNSLLEKLCCGEYCILDDPMKMISQRDFYAISKKILGNGEVIKGQETKNMTVQEMYECVLKMLKQKTSDNRYCLEMLIEKGAFSDYNQGKPIPEIMVFNGKTQPIFDYKQCLFEKVFVETPVDTDGDGKRDLIAVYIRRPKETLQGMKVSAIYVANPYMLECNEDWYIGHNVDKDLCIYDEQHIAKEHITFNSSKKQVPDERVPKGFAKVSPTEEINLDCIPDWYRYFNSRGYATVFAGGLGTRGSQGFNSCGSEEETMAIIAVIDWLCGRRKAYTNKTDRIEIKADWCTGKVAMSGKSYLGTLAIAAASTGVEGLKTIIPEAAICNWYDYYRYNGLNVPALGWQGDDADLLTRYCFSRRFDEEDYNSIREQYEKKLEKIIQQQDRESGNYNRFWDERNYMNHAGQIKSSVYIVHGLNDWNVKPNQFNTLWRSLEKYNVPCKMMLHQGDHIYIHNLGSIDFNDIMNRWLDYWLYDIDNCVMEEVPNVLIQSNVDENHWDCSRTWPFEGIEVVPYKVNNHRKLSIEVTENLKEVSFTDDLGLTPYNRETNNLSEWLDSVVMEPEIEKRYRLAYVTDPLEKDTRISGTIHVALNAALDQSTGIISAMLVDYGKDHRLTLKQKIVKSDGIWWGKNAGTADVVNFVKEENSSMYRVISRGWMNVQNRTNNYCKEAVIPGQAYLFEFDMVPMDYTVKAGHRLGLIIYGTDAEATQRPYLVTNYRVKENSIIVQIPLL